MSYTTIQLAYDSGVATLTLNRPDKRNAISFELIDDLLRALDDVAKSDAVVLIVTGAGKAFCSGMDLDNLKALIGRSPEQNLKDSETMVPAVPFALRVSESNDCSGKRRGHCGRHWARPALRLHAGSAGSEIRLHRSAHRVCAGHRVHISFAAGGGEAGTRSVADGKNF